MALLMLLASNTTQLLCTLSRNTVNVMDTIMYMYLFTTIHKWIFNLVIGLCNNIWLNNICINIVFIYNRALVLH